MNYKNFLSKDYMKKVLFVAIFLLIISVRSAYAADSNNTEVMEELSIYITNQAQHPVYVEYYVGPSWDSASTKGSQSVPIGAVNLLTKEGVACYGQLGKEGVSKNQRNVITVNVYDNDSNERRWLGTQTAKDYFYYDKDITRDKGNYWQVNILENDEVTVRQTRLFTGRGDKDGNLGRKAAHYNMIRAGAFQVALLIGLISVFLFFISMNNGMLVGSNINKLGLLFLVINSLAIAASCVVDTVDAVETNQSGFAMIPILILNIPAFLLASPLAAWIINLVPMPVGNADAIVDQCTIITKSIGGVMFLIFGGLQWYYIGSFISWKLDKAKGQSK